MSIEENQPLEHSLNQTPSGYAQPEGGSTKSRLEGYPKLARLMGSEPPTEIFRRFRDLAMLNLLRLQAELHDLEEQLQHAREDDAQSGDSVRMGYVFDFQSMRDWMEEGDSVQYDLLVKMGEVLERYRIFHSFISKIYSC